MAEPNGNPDREAELDRKIAEIRRKNEELIRRKQEIENDRVEASKVEGGAVSLSGSGSPDRDDYRTPTTNVRGRLGKVGGQNSENGSTATDSHLVSQQQQNKSERPKYENRRQDREKPDKERSQWGKNSPVKGQREWDAGKPNFNAPVQHRRSSEEDRKGGQGKGSPKNGSSTSPTANQKANRPTNQNFERWPRQKSVPEDSELSDQKRTVVASGDQIIISVATPEKSTAGSPASKSVKSRLGPRVQPSQPTAGSKSKPERVKQNQSRVEQNIQLHVLPLDADHKVAPEKKQPFNTNVPSETISKSDNITEDSGEWEDVEEEESNNNEELSPDKCDKNGDSDSESKEAGTRKIRTDTFDRIQQEMIDKLTENVDAVEALMDESDDDIDALLAGKQLFFSRRFDRERQAESDVAECVGDMVKRVSLD
uniref:Uncharacterized protein n=1 Tax=Plectus sambesii TaxID=2011161 RepID=A0A914V9E2_9BILA